ncbi:MAG: hypothetical protein ACJ76H_16660, partial [Bacteriovoracaceae bacterium]
MSVFDLKPLSAKTISELKLKTDQLWEIKIDENIYGPFETLQLKHYSKENRSIMLRAYVSLMSVDSWRPFLEVREFFDDVKSDGPFWTLCQGQKSSPLSKAEVAKRIELGTITRHDEISEDEGRHWHRIANHPEFEAHFTTGSSLPEVPNESSFTRSKQKVLEQLENKGQLIDNIASLTHVSMVTKEKTKTVNIDNIKLPVEKSSSSGSFWENHKSHFLWASPVVLVFVYFTFLKSPSTSNDVAELREPEEQKSFTQTKRARKDSWSRSPASNDQGDDYDRSGVTQLP